MAKKKKIDVESNIINTEESVNESVENITENNTEDKKENTMKDSEKAISSKEISSEKENSIKDIDDIENIILNNKIKKKHRRRIIIGAVMVFLMVVGVISIIMTGVNTTAKLFDNTKEKEEYEKLLTTLVVSDPLPFETFDQADKDLILASSIWAAVMNEDMEKFEKNDFGQTYLPSLEVDKYFTKVFGTQHTLDHRTFLDQEVEFEYNQEKQAYAIPQTSFPMGFTPKVEKITKKGKDKIVTVGYISPANSWSDVSDGSISKYVDYIFQKQGKSYALVAIRDSAMKVEAPVK